MATNTMLTATVIAREALRILTNNIVFSKKINRAYEKEWGKTVNGYKKGATINIRQPARFTVNSGPNLNAENFTENYTTLTINNQHHVDVQFSTVDLTLNLSEFSERVLKPQMVALANYIDNQAMLSIHSQVYNLIGTPGQTPNSFRSIGNAMQRLNEEAAPTGDDISCLLNPAAEIALADAVKGTFDKQSVGEAFRKGYLTSIAGADLFLSQGIPNHQVGALGGTPVVNGASQTGSSLVTNGWTASVTGILNAGDVFTIPGVYAVNPLTQQSTGALRNFVVTATVNSDAGGNVTIPIYPAITTSGAYQTVTASPASGAAITVISGAANSIYPQNLIFHKDAFAFASLPLEEIRGVQMYAQVQDEGLTLRMVQQYQIGTDVIPCRMDVLWGINTVFPQLAARITG